MNLHLTIERRGPSTIEAQYSCPCGCQPKVAYERGTEAATDTCCCGNEFAVGDAELTHVPRVGFERRLEQFQAPWGESLSAVWAIGASTHRDEHRHEEPGETLGIGLSPVSGPEGAGGAADPVCGMTVDPESARARGLQSTHRAEEYFFCGKGCKLEFGDDPERYLDPAYVPSM
jgi:YHS domain-containing protein